MELDISKHGDILERNYSGLIDQRLPAYSEIWKRFIGNTGKGRMIEIPNLQEDEERKRIIFSQYHYSCFESIVGMNLLVGRISSTSISDIDEYVQINNDFLSFQAHAGRIRDCVRRMGELFGLDNLDKGLNDFYQQRNEVLHGCKVPYMIIEGMLAIPPIRGEEEILSRWHSKRSWHEMDPSDFEFLSDYVLTTFNGVVDALNSALCRLLPKIKETTERLGITLDLDNGEHLEYSASVSGLLENHVFNVVRFQNKSGSLS